MRILAIDTAGPVVGVALLHGDAIAVRTARVVRGSDALLVPWAHDLCAEAGVSLAQIDAVAVAVGPGAFTGLRVGLATALGLAVSIGCPVWAGSSLEARASAVDAPTVLAMLDARKRRVYALLRQPGAVRHGPADVAPQIAVSWAGGAFAATGEGALVYADIVAAAGGVVVTGAEDPAVASLAELARQGLERGEGRDPGDILPVYLRLPDAKRPVRGPEREHS